MKVDVLIIGAGAAGASAAAILAPHLRVAMVDAVTAPAWRIGETLPAAARKPLAAIGAWDGFAVAHHGAAPVKLSRWGSDDLVAFDGLRDPDGTGWRIDRTQFERDLRENAVHRGARLIVPVRVRTVARSGGMWRADIGSKRVITAPVIIDASGRTTRFLRPFGQRELMVDRLCCAYQLAEQRDDDPSSYVHAVENGWWYSAAVPGHRRIVAFHSDSDLGVAQDVFGQGPLAMAARVKGLEALTAGIDPANVAPPGMCAAFSSARSAAGLGWLAVGDAALSFDPLSSQGMFNALVTGIEGGRAALGLFDTQPHDAVATDYAGLIGDVWTAYARHHGSYYGMEQRWAASEFWKRRHLQIADERLESGRLQFN